jgi:hypothetical protein
VAQAAYAVLTEIQVDEEMNHAVSEVAEVLSVPDDDAAAVLRLCTWYACNLLHVCC